MLQVYLAAVYRYRYASMCRDVYVLHCCPIEPSTVCISTSTPTPDMRSHQFRYPSISDVCCSYTPPTRQWKLPTSRSLSLSLALSRHYSRGTGTKYKEDSGSLYSSTTTVVLGNLLLLSYLDTLGLWGASTPFKYSHSFDLVMTSFLNWDDDMLRQKERNPQGTLKALSAAPLQRCPRQCNSSSPTGSSYHTRPDIRNMLIFVHLYIHTCMHVCIHTCIHVHTYICTCTSPTCLHTYRHTYIPTYLPTYLSTYLHTFMCTYKMKYLIHINTKGIHTHTYVYVCFYVCIYRCPGSHMRISGISENSAGVSGLLSFKTSKWASEVAAQVSRMIYSTWYILKPPT